MARFGEQVFNETDPQQFRVYRAERATAFCREPIFGSLAEIRVEMARVMASPTWRALSRHTLQEGRGVELRKGRGRRAKAYVFVERAPRIVMPPHQWNRRVLFHVLAHCVRGRLTATHGPQFTASYLRLVHDCWSPELAYQLRAKFAQHDVRVHAWWEPGTDIPVPHSDTIAMRRDEGAEEEMRARREELRAAFVRLRELTQLWNARAVVTSACS